MEKPISTKQYFNSMQFAFKMALQTMFVEKDKLEAECKGKRDKFVEWLSEFKTNLADYPEFVEDRYINGRILTTLGILYRDENINNETRAKLLEIINYFKAKKRIAEIDRCKVSYQKCLKLNHKQYLHIIKTFYTKIQEYLLQGYGYVYDNRIGWICFNRNLYRQRESNVLDYAKTKANKKRLIEQGVHLWNKAEEEWAKANGLPYNGVDYRIFRKPEAIYELPLLDCTLPNAYILKFKKVNYRPAQYAGITNEQLLKQTGGDVNEIYKLNIDLKTKLSLCLEADKLLYTKFIRNENQESVKHRTPSSKSRQ